MKNTAIIIVTLVGWVFCFKRSNPMGKSTELVTPIIILKTSYSENASYGGQR